MDFTTALGLLAGALTTTSFFPQLLKLIRTKSAEDISTGMFVMFCTGVALWLIYGMIHRDIALIAANSVTLILALMILVLKVKYTHE